MPSIVTRTAIVVLEMNVRRRGICELESSFRDGSLGMIAPEYVAKRICGLAGGKRKSGQSLTAYS
jgi:hypothetical protein